MNANVKDTFRNILSNVKETLNKNGVDGEMANKKISNRECTLKKNEGWRVQGLKFAHTETCTSYQKSVKNLMRSLTWYMMKRLEPLG